MQRSVLHIISLGLAAGVISMLYFLLLAVGFIPFPVIVLVVAGGLLLFYRYSVRAISRQGVAEDSISSLKLMIAGIGMLTIVSRIAPHIRHYGEWDAWAIWNLQAKYLADPAHWQRMFLNIRFGHPDYPLLLPGTTAFFSRLFPLSSIEAVSFVFSCCILLFIPLLIYIQQAAKGIIIATYTLFMLATDNFLLSQGVAMYADVTLAFFLLCAVVCIRQPLPRHMHVVYAAAALGCCIWTKNEGVVLAFVFSVFYFRELFLGGRAKYFAAGIGLPLVTLLFFKVVYAPGNDMMGDLSSDTLAQLTEWSRYKQIYLFFREAIDKNFYYMQAGVLIYGIICLIKREWPGKDALMILTCLGLYFMIYVLSTQNLEWHLSTSADRLLLQLMPAAVFIIADRMSAFSSFSFLGAKVG